MKKYSIAILIFGESDSKRNALAEDKYRGLVSAFQEKGFGVDAVIYNDLLTDNLARELLHYDGILVWVNPIEQGQDRKTLDALLMELSNKGCFVSTHPEVILKMGTKDVLYKTKDMGWGGDVKMYMNYEDFTSRFSASLQTSGVRVLKQYRGNGGNGVFKIIAGPADKEVKVVHAKDSRAERILSWRDFNNEFNAFFSNDGLLIDQEWNKNIVNGMVRCYLSGTKVAGFGYQEINALYELNGKAYLPGKRYYYTENCGLFTELKEIMENEWVPQLQNSLLIDESMLPVIWDADFFINKPNSNNAAEKYTLCEINVSCVSPFPPGAVNFIVDKTKNRIKNIKQ